MQKLLTFFSKNISVYAIFNDQSFNDMLTNDTVSFEQLGLDNCPRVLSTNFSDKMTYGNSVDPEVAVCNSTKKKKRGKFRQKKQKKNSME